MHPTVRTRVAPSPTGDPHVGTAYQALISYCFAKHHGGQFLLRIEDTDRVRSTRASEAVILDSLHWLGLNWDEGPDVGGPHGPYRQSERLSIYTRYAQHLLDDGHAFRCFCTPERLTEMRDEQRRRNQPPAYDGRCLHLSAAEIERDLAAHVPYVLRMKVPANETIVVYDLLRGPIEFDTRNVDMQVLMKSDGWPTYHLANVVDDHLMEITHVLRGEEWISSAPKHLLLYRYFGWEMPKLGHTPLLRNADRSKLSKRKNPTSILFYDRMGYLPEALLNFLGALVITHADGDELMDLATMVERIDLEHVALAGPIFDVAKLDHLNGRYLRERLDVDAFAERVRRWALNPAYLSQLAPLAQTRIERLSDLGPLLAPFFSGRIPVSAASFQSAKLDETTMRKLFALSMWEFDALPSWDAHGAERVIRDVAERVGKKLRDAVRPLYIAMTGSATSVPLFEAMEILGRDIVRERLRVALEVLGPVTAAEQKAWSRELADAGPEAAA